MCFRGIVSSPGPNIAITWCSSSVVGHLLSVNFLHSANQSTLLALAAMLNIRLERKTEIWQRTIQGTFHKFGSNWPSGFGEEAGYGRT
jgi:hypothetical protein